MFSVNAPYFLLDSLSSKELLRFTSPVSMNNGAMLITRSITKGTSR